MDFKKKTVCFLSSGCKEETLKILSNLSCKLDITWCGIILQLRPHDNDAGLQSCPWVRLSSFPNHKPSCHNVNSYHAFSSFYALYHASPLSLYNAAMAMGIMATAAYQKHHEQHLCCLERNLAWTKQFQQQVLLDFKVWFWMIFPITSHHYPMKITRHLMIWTR